MAVDSFFNKVVLTERLVKDNDESPTDTEEYQSYLDDIPCLIYPLEDSYGEDIQGSYGKDFIMICGILDIKEKDKVIDGWDEYIVVGLKEYNFLGTELMELRIRLVPSSGEES